MSSSVRKPSIIRAMANSSPMLDAISKPRIGCCRRRVKRAIHCAAMSVMPNSSRITRGWDCCDSRAVRVETATGGYGGGGGGGGRGGLGGGGFGGFPIRLQSNRSNWVVCKPDHWRCCLLRRMAMHSEEAEFSGRDKLKRNTIHSITEASWLGPIRVLTIPLG
jgi:hypothetical protein